MKKKNHSTGAGDIYNGIIFQFCRRAGYATASRPTVPSSQNTAARRMRYIKMTFRHLSESHFYYIINLFFYFTRMQFNAIGPGQSMQAFISIMQLLKTLCLIMLRNRK
ncbi:hypothetical protein AB840_10200 [Megasphaera cerevisiae DSM 20462]|uniref:Uncharacterized protein n=1 Tax=Megasphaera cerevisiae DSM 20462 TaxID=1122219 RepID=A0A0J6WW77_9FIRM|nr:hypothetical protein AB840_10200 [Megasphaera cerevisiae DSM 20462]